MKNLDQALRIAMKAYDANEECVITVGTMWGMQVNILVNLAESPTKQLVPDDGIRLQFIGIKDNGAISKYYGTRVLPTRFNIYDYADMLITQELTMAAKRRKFLQTFCESETEAVDKALLAM